MSKVIDVLRSEVRRLSRQVARLNMIMTVPSAPAQKPSNGDAVFDMRYSARSVRAQRKRVKMSAEEYAKALGVSMQALYAWEQGRIRPRRAQRLVLFEARKWTAKEARQRLAEALSKKKVK